MSMAIMKENIAYITFNPSVRNYLGYKVHQDNKQQKIQESYSEQFSLYYYKLVEQTYDAIGTKDHVLSLVQFQCHYLARKR